MTVLRHLKLSMIEPKFTWRKNRYSSGFNLSTGLQYLHGQQLGVLFLYFTYIGHGRPLLVSTPVPRLCQGAGSGRCSFAVQDAGGAIGTLAGGGSGSTCLIFEGVELALQFGHLDMEFFPLGECLGNFSENEVLADLRGVDCLQSNY